MVKVQLDENGYFTGNYAIIGDIENSIDVEGLPTVSEDKFTSCKLENGQWIFNEDMYNEVQEKKRQETEKYNKQVKISELQRELDSTDYKIIKCSECQLLGQELPYDVTELHTQRQAIRDEINKLQEELA